MMTVVSFLESMNRESRVPAELFVLLFQETCLELRSPAIMVLKGVLRRLWMSTVRRGVFELLYTATSLSSELQVSI